MYSEREIILSSDWFKRRETTIECIPVKYCVFQVSPSDEVSLLHDENFVNRGIVVGWGGWLLDWDQTLALHGTEKLGVKPEVVLEEAYGANIVIDICPTNWGWQYGLFDIVDGKLITLPHDDRINQHDIHKMMVCTTDGWKIV